MTRNRFSSKFQSKSTTDLEAIVASPKEFQKVAVEAAKIELEKRRANGTLDESKKSNRIELIGEERYDDFFKTIPKKSSFAFTPKYSERFQTGIPNELVHAIVEKAFERLGWDIVFSDITQVEAKRNNSFNSWSEKIIVVNEKGNTVYVQSISLGRGMWDNGRNSKLVRLFIHVYKEIEAEYDEEKLAQLEQDISYIDNWDDYVIPDSLPKPGKFKEPQLLLPVIAGVIASVVLGGVFALATKYFYVIMLYEIGIGIALAFILNQGVKLGNYTNYLAMRVIMGLCVVTIVILAQYFQYLSILAEYGVSDLSFSQFLRLRIEAGFVFRDLNTGWIGWLVVIALQLTIIYYACWLRMVSSITVYQYKRVPQEVIDFAVFHFVKGKSEIQVKNELAMKGWINRQDQESVLEAIGAIQGQQELRRME